MISFVTLHDEEGEDLYVNPGDVSSISPYSKYDAKTFPLLKSRISFNGINSVFVTETPAEVIDIITKAVSNV